jgi:hypothetical protein
MRYSKITYRPLIAAILLVTYAFISTPVQLWHHHNVVNSSEEGRCTKERFIQTKGIYYNKHCSVCKHQYSAYHDGVIIPAVPDPREFSSQNGYYTLALVYPPLFSFQNKGPPFLT